MTSLAFCGTSIDLFTSIYRVRPEDVLRLNGIRDASIVGMVSVLTRRSGVWNNET